MTPVEKLLFDLVSTFSKLQIPYAMIGGWAVRAHGVPRPTYDVDLTVQVDRESLPDVFDKIDRLGYEVDEVYRKGWTDDVAGMPLVKATTFVDGRTLVGDIFLAEQPFQLSVLKRKQHMPVDGFQAWVASAEDVILLKLIAGRHRDLGDVQDILFIQGQLDESYMRLWAAELGVSEKLGAALDEAKESGEDL